METIQIKINDKIYNALIAESEEEKENGLKGVIELEELEDGSQEAMLFPYDSPQHLDFWMVDCEIPLSIIFLDDKKVVLSNQRGEPGSEEYISEDNAQYVLEVNPTDDIKPGDIAEFNLDRESTEESSTEDLDPEKLYILNEDGTIQHQIDPGVRIFSRKSTAVMIKKAKKAFESKSDVDYRDLGRYIFGELDRQTNRPEEYVES